MPKLVAFFTIDEETLEEFKKSLTPMVKIPPALLGHITVIEGLDSVDLSIKDLARKHDAIYYNRHSVEWGWM